MLPILDPQRQKRLCFALRWEREPTCCVPRGLLSNVLDTVIVCVGSRARGSHYLPPHTAFAWKYQLT